MCGVVACLGVANLSEATALLAHRGIRQKIISTKSGSIGHVRLPIVGIGEENDQPVISWPWTIGFVGEILDFRERDSKVTCDLDTVVKAWVEHGPTGLKYHDGFWGIVAVNDRESALHILCDYLAQKPMYYRQDKRAAASEINALLSFGPTTPDEVYLSAVIKWGYCPDTTRTPHCEIKHVLPGEHVILYADGCVNKEIVDPLIPVKMSPAVLKSEIELAVQRRVLSSDVPVAALISGGLDSSIVYTLAKCHGDVRPYYARPRGDVNIAEQNNIAAIVGTRLLTTEVWDDVEINHAIAVMQEPIDLGSLIPQMALAGAVKERVCLTGDGADELFGGYGRSQRYDSQGSDVFQELVAWHLPRLDRIMMRNRIEVRSPFLARRVVQTALGLPIKLRTGKKVLKDLFRGDLPSGIADQEKIPLRTATVDHNRESNSRTIVEKFRRMTWGS